jgi:ABC-2 type transport system permease protein
LVAATVVVAKVPTGSRLLYAPAAILVTVLFGTALGLMLAAVNVYLRDVQYLVEVALMVWFWTTPTVYSWSQVEAALADRPALLEVYLANPVTIAVLGFQRAFWVAGDPASFPSDLGLRLLVMAAVSTVLLFIAHRVFVRLEGNFAQEL